MNNSIPSLFAYVSAPFLGEAWAERGGVTRGRYFLDYLASRASGDEGDWLTVFAGEWAVCLDAPPTMPRLLRPAWIVFAGPILAASAMLKAVFEQATGLTEKITEWPRV
jgi:hypothetical protein